jgi:hypothetical protein
MHLTGCIFSSVGRCLSRSPLLAVPAKSRHQKKDSALKSSLGSTGPHLGTHSISTTSFFVDQSGFEGPLDYLSLVVRLVVAIAQVGHTVSIR